MTRQFLKRNDHLIFDAVGSTALLLSIEVEAEFAGPDGRYRQVWRDMSWAMNRSGETFVGPGFLGTLGLPNPLGEDGFLEDLTIRATFSGSVKRGELFVRGSIRAGGLSQGIPLMQGYLHTHKQATRLGMFEDSTSGQGFLRVISLGDPAAGADYVAEPVPTNTRWRVRSFTGTLVADANASNRRLEITYEDPTNVYARTVGPNITANQSPPHAGNLGMGDVTTPSVSVAALLVLPDVLMEEADELTFSTSGLLAGDNWGEGFIGVEEWLVF